MAEHTETVELIRTVGRLDPSLLNPAVQALLAELASQQAVIDALGKELDEAGRKAEANGWVKSLCDRDLAKLKADLERADEHYCVADQGRRELRRRVAKLEVKLSDERTALNEVRELAAVRGTTIDELTAAAHTDGLSHAYRAELTAARALSTAIGKMSGRVLYAAGLEAHERYQARTVRSAWVAYDDARADR